MRIGLQLTGYTWKGSPANIGEKLAEIAGTADDVGFKSLWLPDHLLNAMNVFGSPIDAPILEGYTTMAYLAALTRRIKVGLLVTCNMLRHPALLVKMVSTLDVLSGGRAYFGVGAGWFEREMKGLGFSFPPIRERFERLEETLQIAHQMWRGDTTPFNGKYYQLAEPVNSPQPLSKPHPPILIGGSGEKKTLRLIAKYGDAGNLFIGSPLEELPASFRKTYENRLDFLSRKLSILKQHCDDVGRLYREIEKTVQTYVKVAPNAQLPSEVVALCRELADLGIEHVIFNMPNMHEIEPLRIIGEEVVPLVEDV
jgi:F420-dependent oxidoreductase-like protein